MVEETLINEMRSAISVLSSSAMFSYFNCAGLSAAAVLSRLRSRASTEGGTSPVILPPRRKTSLTRRELMNEWASLDHQEHRLDLRPQPAIHQRHLQFLLVIRNGADAAQQHGGATGRGIIHQQPFKMFHLHIRISRAKLRAAISMRSSTLNNGSFSSLSRIETISRSKSLEPRSIKSRCPLVMGSNEPG